MKSLEIQKMSSAMLHFLPLRLLVVVMVKDVRTHVRSVALHALSA